MRLTGVPLLTTVGVCLALALVCHIIALATDHWVESGVSGGQAGAFLRLGLWTACFDYYLHMHENPPRRYDGCHQLYSDYYVNIRPWLIPSWLVVCRVLAIISLVLLIFTVILFVFLVLSAICRLMVCDERDDCWERVLLYATPITCILAGLFLLMTIGLMADNAFRLQCKEYWLGGSEANSNYLGFSWGFELVACLSAFVSSGFVVWLVVLKAREDI